ncbi:hypothetical protein HNP32_001282 [Brevundimonas bullata]|uniref:Uncharacterized protein n=1 Tax=Brevundimonas bullata TaxID=13160 RepID=A0A7W7INF0_9CAUL|nr:hypothetical protein [Brevundimonas bullata]MBB4797558.1 hypothetical protein [Brevundimonas bullata]MBB6382518.1 hypothetical protein [Brevundimonas bullata]
MSRAKTLPVSPAELSALADRVEVLLKSAQDLVQDKDRYSAVARAERSTAMASLKIVLEGELKAKINPAHDACRIRIAGVSSSSTSGFEGAVRNWINAARRKAGA